MSTEARQKELKQKAKKEASNKKELASEEVIDANADMPEVESAFFAAVGISNGESGGPPPGDDAAAAADAAPEPEA